MAAPKKNQFWKARTKHGRDKLFASKTLLWSACCEYFQWVEDNPLKEEKLFAYQGEITKASAYKMRAMTIHGLCLFLDIDRSTWTDWKTDDDFSAIVTRVEDVIYSQKFSGAAADLLNANIIARDLGLKEQTDLSSKDGTMTPKAGLDASKLSTETLQELMKAYEHTSSDAG